MRFPTQSEIKPFCWSALRAIPSSLSKFERRLDSLSASQEVPRDVHRNWRGTPSFSPQLEMRTYSPAVTWEESQVPLTTWKRSDFPEATWVVPWGPQHNSRGTQSFLPQLKKHHKIPPSMWDEAWFPCFNLRGILTFPLHIKRRPVSPIETQEETCGSGHKSKWHQVPTQLEIRPDSPARTQMESQVSPHNSKGGLLPCCTSRKKPSSPPELDRRSDTTFTAREESRIPYLNTRRALTPLMKLDRSPKIPVATGEVPWVSFLNLRWCPIPLKWLERNPEVPLTTLKETWLPGETCEVPWGLRCNSRGTQSCPAQLEKHHEILPSMRNGAPLHCSDLRAIPCYPLQLERRRLSWGNMRGSQRFLSQLERNPKLPTTTLEKTQDSPLDAIWGPFLLHYLKSNPKLLLKTQKEAWLPLCNSRGSWR